MGINEELLRKYMFHNQVLKEHIEGMTETYLEGCYDDEAELRADMKYSQRRILKINEIEKELLEKLNNA